MSGKPVVVQLVRHGEAAAGWGVDPDPGLSELGHQEAQAVADNLAASGSTIKSVVSSPLRRAQETAAPLAARLGVTAEIDRTFRELPAPVALAERSDWLRTFMTESWSSQCSEIQGWRRAIIERLSATQRDVAIFTHFVVLNAVVSHITGNEKTHCFTPGNGSVTTLHVTDGVLSLHALGVERDSVVN